jgi:hypothetical protein
LRIAAITFAVRWRMLPNGDLAYIEDAKLLTYRLSRDHSTGRGKAGFLQAAGFDLEDAAAVRAALLAQARANPVAEALTTKYGLKFRVDGPLVSPTGVAVRVRTVWHVDTGQIAPRFVTMRPL